MMNRVRLWQLHLNETTKLARRALLVLGPAFAIAITACGDSVGEDEVASDSADLRRCDDGNPCTTDARTRRRCIFTPIPGCVPPADAGSPADGSSQLDGAAPPDAPPPPPPPPPTDAGVGGNPSSVPAPTVLAATCNGADVQNALDIAADGDVVGIPAGTCTWTKTVRVANKRIVIAGAGTSATVIVDNVPKLTGIDSVALDVSLAIGKRFRLTSLTLRGLTQDVNVYNKGTVSLSGASRDFRIDHVKFDRPGTSAIRYQGDLWGVVDHNDFDMSAGGQANVIYHDTWGGRSYGDGSFAEPLYLGTEKAIYIEDNTFLGTGTAGRGVVDSMGGGRFVFRHNEVLDENLCTHGTESTGRYRGVRSYEIYGNKFVSRSTVFFTGVYLRGGTGVVFDNSFDGYKFAVLAANYRSDSAYSPWGKCAGTSPFDGNQAANGYPCIDQVGRGRSDLLAGATPAATWPNQALEPLYIWNVAWTPAPEYPGALAGSQHDVIQEGRDYFVGTPRPSYTTYVYPHPGTLY